MTAPNPEISAAFRKTGNAASDVVYAARVSGDAFDRWQLQADGTMTFKDGTGATVLTITTSGALTAAGLPTADPHVVGQLWNSTGTLKVSAG